MYIYIYYIYIYKYGYFPEPSKSVLVVKEGKEERAREVFAEYPDLEIVSHHRFLGGCVGASAGVEAYVRKKVATWVERGRRRSSLSLRTWRSPCRCRVSGNSSSV